MLMLLLLLLLLLLFMGSAVGSFEYGMGDHPFQGVDTPGLGLTRRSRTTMASRQRLPSSAGLISRIHHNTSMRSSMAHHRSPSPTITHADMSCRHELPQSTRFAQAEVCGLALPCSKHK
jgi:hypothetical protein